MHELSITQSLCEQLTVIARAHHARRIARVALELGALSNVVPELLREAFYACREGDPLLETAGLEIRSLPLRVRCRSCRAESEPAGRRLRCSACGGVRVDVIHGEELLLRDVEMEVEPEGVQS
ncbi:MAG TPA: hydrogenase maturation nickel metallochaperone HypA [Candidatus Eisenbacteria bacterium]|jgi:hydrogenase nickel incorporation protein HypA/HybF